ncbi:glycosyltransferase 52 family protein [Vibrio navarrensis]|nr:glycosyltransferase 52 family protein [Vibrio navarrensis]EJL6566984.1 glycosyltransferase 52 family protein [Vibrio navarrensis]
MNVFLVTSPFQYICANEARVAYQTQDNILILIEQDNPTGQRQMAALVQEHDWKKVLRFPRNKRTSVTPKIIKEVQRLSEGQLDTLFYSEYNAWRSKLIIRNLSFKKHVFFDDGTMTFFDYYDHIEPKSVYYRPRFIQDIQLRLQGIKPIGHLGFFENTEIFSIFDFPDCVTSYRENKLTTLQCQVSLHAEQKSESFIFIGQGSIDEKGRISLHEYLKLITLASQKSSTPLIYIPHRTEASHVSENVKKIANLTYHQSQFPIELELVKQGIKPSCIIGLSSTALYTLSKIYPDATIRLISQSPTSTATRDLRIYNYLQNYFTKRTYEGKSCEI